MKSVRFEEVVVRYPGADRNAVDSVSFEADAGSFTVLLGPSGCGKSTLLRTVNRLVVPASGRVLIGGEDTAALDPIALRRSIGYVIQAVGLFPHLTVEENVSVVPTLLRWDRPRMHERAAALLEMVGLDPARYARRYPRELSGGEQQRVGVARAIAAEPPVLLMDEPFGAVDAIVRTSLQSEMLRIVRSLHTTILFVTHDVEEALRLADRLVVMRDGHVEQYDTPLRVLTSPATPYVAQLLEAHDAVRRLSLLTAGDAARSDGAAAVETIDAGATLREALNRFLNGGERLAVLRGETRIGTLTFDDVRAALRS